MRCQRQRIRAPSESKPAIQSAVALGACCAFTYDGSKLEQQFIYKIKAVEDAIFALKAVFYCSLPRSDQTADK